MSRRTAVENPNALVITGKLNLTELRELPKRGDLSTREETESQNIVDDLGHWSDQQFRP